MPDIPQNINDLVGQYVTLRDRIKEADDNHKKKVKAAKEYLEALETQLLGKLNDVGGESVKTPSGTVYRTERKSASIADGDLFRGFVKDNELYDLVDWKANALAVADFIKDNQVPPPGVNFSVAYTVGVRRA